MHSFKLISDTDLLFRKLPEVHYDLYELITKNKFHNLHEKIIEQINMGNYTTNEFGVILQQLFSEIGDPHTRIEPDYHPRPIRFEWINGKFYAFVVPYIEKEFLYKEVLSVDGIDIKDFVGKPLKYLVYENDEGQKLAIADALSNIPLIKFVSKDRGQTVIYSFKGGKTLRVGFSAKNRSADQKGAASTKGNEFLNMRDNYFVRNETGNLYLRYARCREDENYPIKELKSDIQRILKEKPDKILVDIRNNSGGNSSLFMPILETLKMYVDTTKPKVYGLINRKVFSSGVLNTHQMKEILHATLVGQPCAQGVNHYGEVKTFSLPNSRLTVQYSTKYFKIIEDDSTIIQPDVHIEPTIEDYKKGRDVVKEWCESN